MNYREATLDDIAQIQVVRNAVKENRLSNPGLVKNEDCARQLQVIGKGWVGEIDGLVAGFSILDISAKNIWALFVLPDFEKQGIGSHLHNIMVNWYYDRYVGPLWLSTAPGTRAEQFYIYKGWVKGGTTLKGETRFTLTKIEWTNLPWKSA